MLVRDAEEQVRRLEREDAEVSKDAAQRRNHRDNTHFHRL